MWHRDSYSTRNFIFWYRTPNIVRVIHPRRLFFEVARHVAGMGIGKSAFNVLTGKPAGARSLGIKA